MIEDRMQSIMAQQLPGEITQFIDHNTFIHRVLATDIQRVRGWQLFQSEVDDKWYMLSLTHLVRVQARGNWWWARLHSLFYNATPHQRQKAVWINGIIRPVPTWATELRIEGMLYGLYTPQ